jgi:hypothetical protein
MLVQPLRLGTRLSSIPKLELLRVTDAAFERCCCSSILCPNSRAVISRSTSLSEVFASTPLSQAFTRQVQFSFGIQDTQFCCALRSGFSKLHEPTNRFPGQSAADQPAPLHSHQIFDRMVHFRFVLLGSGGRPTLVCGRRPRPGQPVQGAVPNCGSAATVSVQAFASEPSE